MANQGEKPHLYPTAPPLVGDMTTDFHRGAPPPSYEESLKMSANTRHNNQPPHYQQPQPTHQSYQYPAMPTHHQQPLTYGPPPVPVYSGGYVNPYPVHMQQHQMYYSNTGASSSSRKPQNPIANNVLEFDKRAEIKTNAQGAILVPPPPPGCVPTPAQLAAMSGQQVVVKHKKKSFF
ncbi:uncharacterized protein LOC142227189 [Haematobia irritans]|uniref:uncharacterized protein LOC142227189 n=1 Tax=Haematobia irritans TaxID=7368 RepID=UPI003F4FC56B